MGLVIQWSLKIVLITFLTFPKTAQLVKGVKRTMFGYKVYKNAIYPTLKIVKISITLDAINAKVDSEKLESHKIII